MVRLRFLASSTRVALGVLLPVFGLHAAVAEPETPNVPASIAYDWTGLYVGAFGGFGTTDLEATDLFTDAFGGAFYTPGGNSYGLSADGFLAGGHLGYDWQWDRVVLGIQGEAGFMDLDDSVVNPHALPVPAPAELPVTSFSADWYGSVTGRVGLPIDRFLIYARGGAAFLNAEGSTVDTCARSFCQQTAIDASSDDVLFGWTLGGGIEAAMHPHFRIGVEYRFFDFESLEVSGIANNDLEYHQDIELDGIHTGRAFISYRW